MNSWVSELWPRLRFFVNRQKFEGDLEQEIRFQSCGSGNIRIPELIRTQHGMQRKRLFGNDTGLKEAAAKCGDGDGWKSGCRTSPMAADDGEESWRHDGSAMVVGARNRSKHRDL